MNIFTRWRTAACGLIAAGAAILLTGCIVSPGAFTASLDLRRDGRFTFNYTGQIHLLALSRLAEMANEADAASEDFVEQPCYDEDTLEERRCTRDEIAEQREQWASQGSNRRAEAEREAQAMRAMLGGIDPADPRAAEELAERLRRQEGWRRVDYRGDGLFEVEFEITSTLGHDFAFPTFERFPMSNVFVLATLRQQRTVRIEAPGFAAQGGGNPFQGMMAGMAGMMGAAPGQDGGASPEIPEMNGTFRIVTDGRIRANNTDEGPAETAEGQVLEWKINSRTQSPPMALVELDGG